MDLQKELTDCNNWILEQDDDFVTGYGQGNYALGLARLAWQAAKANAVPEGFVVVPKEPNEEMIMNGLLVISTEIGKHDIHQEVRMIWEKMIEAQEPK